MYWTHFQNIYTFIYQKALLLRLFYLFWKLMKAFTVSSRTDIVLHHIKKHFILIIIYQSRLIKSIYFQIQFIYTIKWGWLGPMFGIFHDLLMIMITATTQPLAPRIYDIELSLSWIENTWSLINRVSSLFSLQPWVVISEMGRLDPIYTGFEAHFIFFFVYSHKIADIKYETVKA